MRRHFILLIVLFFCTCSPPEKEAKETPSLPYFQDSSDYTFIQNKSNQPKDYTLSNFIHVSLDSASSLKATDHSQNKKLYLKLDGKAHFHFSSDSITIVVYTGMMKLTAQNLDFVIEAYNSSPGQVLKVLDGQLISTKSYESNFPNTDSLTKGEMILINIDIDLMEKETFDTSSFVPSL